MPVRVTVHYLDGSQMAFEGERVPEAQWTVSYLDKSISMKTLALQLEDRVIVIPSSSVKYIEVSPPPPKLPAYVARDLRLVSEETCEPAEAAAR
jgi:hypothetical protein